MNYYKLGAFSVSLAAILWAIDGVVFTPWIMKLGLSDVPTIVFMLHLVSSVFLSYFLFRGRAELSQMTRKDWGAFALVGLFGGAIGTMAIVAAILMVYSQGLNIAVVLLLQKMQPIFAIVLALVLLREKPSRSFYPWAIVACIGSYILTFGFSAPHISFSGMAIPGLLALLAAFSFGSSTVFSKRAVTHVSFGVGTALRFVTTTAIMACVVLLIGLLKHFGVETNYQGFHGFSLITAQLLGLFVLIAFTTGGVAILLYYFGLKRITATQSTIYELVFPVAAIILEFMLRDKVLTSPQWIGALLVLFAVFMVSRISSRSLPSSSV